MSTWDIVTTIASDLQLKLELHIQLKENQSLEKIKDTIIREYNLNPLLVSFVIIQENKNNIFQNARDASILSSAEKIIPISIRPDGNLERLVLSYNDKINNSYSIPYKKKKDKVAYTLDDLEINAELQVIKNEYIIHWTKTSKSKWHHERQYDYYNDILNSGTYPRTAFHNLQNIIKSQTIFATPTHMPQDIFTVSFTSLPPVEMAPLFRWRSRYQEMSFEPYGIGIKRETAYKHDIQEVIYYEKDSNNISNLQNKIWLTQSKGIVTNWELECELRHLGDFIFKKIDRDDIILFTRYKKEAAQLQELTGYKTISFEI